MPARRFLATFVVVISVFAVACGSSTAPPATPAPTTAPTATPVPLPTAQPPPPFVAADYGKSDEIAHLLEGIGPERPFPAELLDSSPELPKDEAAVLWNAFLHNSRVIGLKNGEIYDVTDYCDRTGTIQYSPNKPDGGNWFIGQHIVWDVVSTEFASWNQPRLVWPNPLNRDRANFIRRSDYSGVAGGGQLIPAGDSAPSGIRSVTKGTVEQRVFDHPGCAEITPLRISSPEQFNILGFGRFKRATDFIPPDEPQLPADEVVRRWLSNLENTTIFFNLNATPSMLLCENGIGVMVGRYVEKGLYGRAFEWRMEGAGNLAKNAVWTLINGNEGFFADVESELDPYVAFLPVENPDCSADLGLEYVRQEIEREDLDIDFQELVEQHNWKVSRIGLERLREFPEELEPDSPPLGRKEAAEIANQWISNVRAVGTERITDFCSDGTVQVLLGPRSLLVNERGRWQVVPNPDGEWNEPQVAVTFDDPEAQREVERWMGSPTWTVGLDGPYFARVYEFPERAESVCLG